MPWDTIQVRRAVTFVPPEAGRIAAAFRAAASRFRDLANQSASSIGRLDETWEGRSRDAFMLDFPAAPRGLLDLADWLEAAAGRIAVLEVTIWEVVEQRVWIPEPSGAWE